MELQYRTLEDIIRSNLTFLISSPNDWNRLYCELPGCMDGSRTKGPRAGFMLSGDDIGFHCFNCGTSTNYKETYEVISKKMMSVLKAFGIPEKDVLQIVNSKRKTQNTPIPKQSRPKIQHKPIIIPDHFYKLTDALDDNVMAQKAKDMLKNKYGMTMDDHPFYLSTCTTKNPDPKEINMAKSMRNRLIIPAYHNDDMVYYIARFLGDDTKKKYLNAPIPKSNVIYGLNNLHKNRDSYLFVTEGFFDSFHLRGAAVLENHMTKDQIEILNSSTRKKIVVPDRRGDSVKLAEQAIALGWGIALPQWGDCKDVCESVLKYGKLLTLDMIMKGIKEGPSAKMLLNFI